MRAGGAILALSLLVGVATADAGKSAQRLIAILNPAAVPAEVAYEAWAQYAFDLGPAAWFRLGEGSGVDAADEMEAFAGTYINGPTLGQPSLILSDPGNTAVSFVDTNDEYVRFPVLELFDEYSIVAFIQGTLAGFRTIASMLKPVGNYNGWLFDVGGLKLRLTTCDNVNPCTTLTTTTTVHDGARHMVSCVIGNGGGSVFVDSVFDAFLAVMRVPAAGVVGNYSYIGAREDFVWGYEYCGTIDEMLFYKGKSLTQAEQAQLWNLSL